MGHTILQWIGDESLLHYFISDFPTSLLLITIVLCIVLLSRGADLMVDGAVNLTHRIGISKIIIGATIISLGTTTPEAFVSVMAAYMGNPGLALGNGVGSIITDTGLIFGVTCVLAKVPVDRFILNRTGWVQVGSATLLVLISLAVLSNQNSEPTLGRSVGGLFLGLLAIYMYLAFRWAKQQHTLSAGFNTETICGTMGLTKCWVYLLIGLTMIILGARILVPSASATAIRIGIPEDVIAATLIAFGTSLPELMTAIAAIRKGHPEITVGNVVGADVLNCLFVIGAAASARPLAIPLNFYYIHFPVLILILYSFRFFISSNGDSLFKRWQGLWLLTIYFSYIFLQYTLGVMPNH